LIENCPKHADGFKQFTRNRTQLFKAKESSTSSNLPTTSCGSVAHRAFKVNGAPLQAILNPPKREEKTLY
jgi:hypothetical protein